LEVQQSVTGDRKTIGMIITFSKSNKNLLTLRASGYLSSRKGTPCTTKSKTGYVYVLELMYAPVGILEGEKGWWNEGFM
jgi:hypothetical protein